MNCYPGIIESIRNTNPSGFKTYRQLDMEDEEDVLESKGMTLQHLHECAPQRILIYRIEGLLGKHSMTGILQ